MEPGNIIEYIDQQKIICGIILEAKNQKLRILTETDREVKLSENRVSHIARKRLPSISSRNDMLKAVKEAVAKRKQLASEINVEELWEVLLDENDWLDAETIAGICFTEPTPDHESAIVRALFENRTYFKFSGDKFLPYTREHVEHAMSQAKEAERLEAYVNDASAWIKKMLVAPEKRVPEEYTSLIKKLKSYYLYENECRDAQLVKSILTKSGIEYSDKIFGLLVSLGIWDEDENIDLQRLDLSEEFPSDVIHQANGVSRTDKAFASDPARKDLTHLKAITIDGQATKDFDDALSLEPSGDGYILGIHIIDVAHYISQETTLDREALNRASSIYTPDRKIPMFPPLLSENICSLKADELRPAISIMVKVSRFGEFQEYEIVPSSIKVARQLSYTEANKLAESDAELQIMHRIAQTFRDKRLASGAIQITLPEVNVWLEPSGEITISRIDRDSTSRMLVAELMIMGNWLMARFLKENGLPAIFRTQPEPKQRLYKGESDSIFLNIMQRRQLSRALILTSPEPHSGLGLDAYVTATSPIRKYSDLATQRQIKSALGFCSPYSEDVVKGLLMRIDPPMGNVNRIQQSRKRYWIFKYLESRTGTREDALVIDQKRNGCNIILLNYMIECFMPTTSGSIMKPQDTIQVVIQHANARKDLLSVYPG